jgi:hypothetical protein
VVVSMRVPATVPLITHDGVSWGIEPALVRTTVIAELPFPFVPGVAATPERRNPERRNEESAMKLTTKLKPGRKAEWVVRDGRKVVAEINRQLTGGVKMQYRPYLKLNKPADGSNYSWRILAAEDTMEAALENVRAALSEPIKVTDRVSFIGIGMTADRAAKFANAMSRKIAEEGLQ